MTCILLLIYVSADPTSPACDMYPPPHMTCILLLIYVSADPTSPACDMYPPPHMTCILLLIYVSADPTSPAYDMYPPPPHMTCILLLIYVSADPTSPAYDHVKVSDFGFSRDIGSHYHAMRTTCGTPEYMAPEVLTMDMAGTRSNSRVL
jgi:serine/threonine protein kinase